MARIAQRRQSTVFCSNGMSVAAMLACLLSGCSSHDGMTRGKPAEESGAVPRHISADEQAELERAEEMLVLHCMTKAGLPYRMLSPAPHEDPAQHFAYVIDDVTWAHEHAYGMAGEPVGSQEEAPPSDPQAGERARAALFGQRPEGLSARLPSGLVLTASDLGCLSASRRELYEELPAWFAANAVVSNLGILVDSRVRADSRYLAGVRAWSGCMARSGHDYPSPETLREALAKRAASTSPPRIAEMERQVAVAEAQCARQTGLGDLARQLHEQVSAVVRTEYRGDIETLQRIQLAALPRARAVLAAGTGNTPAP